MRLVKRNLKQISYKLYTGQQPIYDDEGYETGEMTVGYGEPVSMMANVSPASGYVQNTMFGNLVGYDKIVITDNMNCPIDENTVLYIDVATTDEPDYVVKKVAKTLNHIAYAVSEVKKSSVPTPEPEPKPEPTPSIPSDNEDEDEYDE